MTKLLIFAIAFTVVAQDQPGAIRGVVKDAKSGAPISEAIVSVYTNARIANGTLFRSSDSKDVRSTTDTGGNYRLADLPPGSYRISARNKSGTQFSSRTVSLRAGQNLGPVDFFFVEHGEVSGRVLDQNKEPMPGMSVALVAKEYTATGGIGYFVKDQSATDDRGVYSLRRLEAGRSYFVMAAKRLTLPAISDAPENPKLRKPAFVPTFFPSAPEPAAAAPLILRPGERRENIDIQIVRSPSFCIQGVLDAGAGPVSGRVSVAGPEISYGIGVGGGIASLPPSVLTSKDGKFRICGLRPATYDLLAILEADGKTSLGMSNILIADRDLADVRAQVLPNVPISGVVAWDGEPPESPITTQLSMFLRPVNRGVFFRGEPSLSARASIPGTFDFPGLFLEEYTVTTNLNLPGVYVKDIRYGTASVLNRTLTPGSTIGNSELRVLLARDGGSISAKVKDKDGNPVSDAHVVIIPEDADALSFVTGDSDQNGDVTYGSLSPGKYHVLATSDPIDRTFQGIQRLKEIRSKAKTIALSPSSAASVTLEPVKVD